jgi:hypothetical protein
MAGQQDRKDGGDGGLDLSWLFCGAVSKVRLSLTRWSPPGVRKIAEQKQIGNLRELTPEAAALQQEDFDCFACDDAKSANDPEILEADPDKRAWAVKLSV